MSAAKGTVAALLLASTAGLVACNAILGTRDLTYDPAAGAEGGADGPSNADAGLPAADAAEAGPELDASRDVGDGSCSPDLSQDTHHCGRCGHDCLGGACAAGACKPVTLASGQGKPIALTLLGGYVYWSNYASDEVRRARTDGTDASLFAQDASFRRPWGITSDGATIYFAASDLGTGGVFSCPTTGCSGAALKRLSTKSSYDVAVRGGVAYYTSRSDGTLARVNVNGTGETTVASINTPFHLAVDATYVYVTSNENDIKRVLLGGGPLENAGANPGDLAGGIFADDTRVFWNYAYYTLPGVILSREKSTGTTTGYTNTARNPIGIAADRAFVYWITFGNSEVEVERTDGQLLACPIAGCPATGPMVLANNLQNGSALALDDAAIYFTELGITGVGTVRKVAKP